MKAKADVIIILSVALCATVLAGEVLTYSGVHSYDAQVDWGDGRVDFGVDSSGHDVYDAVLFDNKGRVAISDLAVYIDDMYSEYYVVACEYSDPPYLDQQYYGDQICTFLKVRSFNGAHTCGPEELRSYMEENLPEPSGKGILVTSYALPSSIYDGTDGCLLMKWAEAGGAVYWVGTEIGRFHVDETGLHTVDGNQSLFFGRDDVLCTSGSTIATGTVPNGFTEALCLKNSNVQNGMDVSEVPGAVDMGYMEDGYSSIAMAPLGSGYVCIFAGPFDFNQLDDIGQIVASGVTPYTEIVTHERGTVSRGHSDSSFEAMGSTLFVYIGGTYTKFAEAFHA